MIRSKYLMFLAAILLILGCKENIIGDFETIAQDDTPGEVVMNKKGAAFTNRSKDWSHKTSALGAHWMYSWGNALRDEIPENVEFVPMFWGRGSVTTENINRIKQLVADGKVKYVLGFNEPDGAAQANMTVDEAIALWPQLEEIGVPLGSPATVSPNNEWMEEFMQKAEAANLRIDFIAIHHYGGPNVGNLINKLKDTYQNYGRRPIWITEFAVADWNATSPANNRHSVAEVEDFMTQALPALDEIEWVHRYAWFSGTQSPLFTSALFDDDAVITQIGNTYAQHTPNAIIGPGQDTDFTPTVDPDEFVINPGFETGLINPWQGFKNGLTQVGGAITPFEGNFCGRIESNDGSLFQVVTVEAGKTYIMKYVSRWSENLTRAGFKPVIRDQNVSGSAGVLFRLPDTPTTDTWQESTFEFTVPSGVTEIRVVFFKGKVQPPFPPFFLDNVSIKEKQ